MTDSNFVAGLKEGESVRLKANTVYNNKELAEWFEIKEATFKSSKKRRLEELKDYADFIVVKGKVKILKVKNAEYVNKKRYSYQVVKNDFNKKWPVNGLSTMKKVGSEIYHDHKEDANFKISEVTTIKYMSKARDELYGKPSSKEGGPLGNCSLMLCKKLENGNIEFFTKEEEEIKRRLKVKYFGSQEDKDLMVEMMLANGEIEEEEAWQVYRELRGYNVGDFLAFMAELEETIGNLVVRGLYVERNEKGLKEISAF